MNRIDDPQQLAVAVGVLTAVESRFQNIVDRHGLPPLRRSADGLRVLLRIVTDQLISLKAGEAIWRRLEPELDPFEPATIARLPDAHLRGLGLSGAKARTFRAVAEAVEKKHIDFDKLATLPDREVLAALTAIKGIGPWTADIYLLSAMGRADAWPTGDLALQVAAQDLLGLANRPFPKDMEQLAEAWRPWRSVAARLLWSHYRAIRGLSQDVS